MTKHHHNLALKNAIFAHWNKYEIYTDNWQEIQKFEQKKLLTSKFVSPNSNFPLIFEFPAKYEQKIKIFIGHSEEKTSQKSEKPPQSMG